MRLVAFRVREFRSVDDSGWIEADQVTALIGTNESGKTNVLIPLWKLNPAKDGAIDPIADYPRKRYHEIRALKKKPVFIEARFDLGDGGAQEIAVLLKVPTERAREAVVSRDFDGKYYVAFPKAAAGAATEKKAVVDAIDAALKDMRAAAMGDDHELRESLVAAATAAKGTAEGASEIIETKMIDAIVAELDKAESDEPPADSVASARFAQLIKAVKGFSAASTNAQAARDLVRKRLPSFVYYSNYGNLDSEIYLPHVIENTKRTDLGQREQAKARTLKVLFDFVRLRPEEIQEMGQDVNIPAGTTLTPDQEKQISAVAEKKKERDILLQSASTELTRRFREWWKQGTYRFRFAADGNHFRIWVSDDKRPEDIELEARSTGLQWFFSFYLIFLVESEDSHEGAILLLDEPGLSLHPLAQSDLSAFFDGLSDTNQLLFTTHSPFMVDADNLDRARAVFSDEKGVTQVSPDLRAPADKSDRSRSVYAAYAAVGMSVSETMLLGCQAAVVEGPSDQHYLSAIKNYLIGNGHLAPSREILFFPGGGVKGVKAICALVMGREDELPFTLVDGDDAGVQFANGLRSSLYNADKARVMLVTDFLSIAKAEIEDLFPPALIAKVVDRYLQKPADLDEDFAAVVKAGEPIVPQIEAYATACKIDLGEGWKVDVAKRVKAAILRSKGDPLQGAESYLEVWKKLFSTIHPAT